MQDCHYNYIKVKYGDKAEILLADTDKLMYKIEAENVYEHFYNKKFFDCRNYSEDSKYYNNANNLVIGNMKDETCDVSIKGFVRLKSKMYTFITEGNHESKKVKHINNFFLFNRSYRRNGINRIQSKYHNIGSYKINKITLLLTMINIY